MDFTKSVVVKALIETAYTSTLVLSACWAVIYGVFTILRPTSFLRTLAVSILCVVLVIVTSEYFSTRESQTLHPGERAVSLSRMNKLTTRM